VIGLDTNVLVRYLTQDDAKQFQEASALMLGLEKQQRKAYLSTVTLCETVWVLARAYKIDRAEIVGMFAKLLDTSLFVIEDKDTGRSLATRHAAHVRHCPLRLGIAINALLATLELESKLTVEIAEVGVAGNSRRQGRQYISGSVGIALRSRAPARRRPTSASI